jgi:hypothetical protein
MCAITMPARLGQLSAFGGACARLGIDHAQCADGAIRRYQRCAGVEAMRAGDHRIVAKRASSSVSSITSTLALDVSEGLVALRIRRQKPTADFSHWRSLSSSEM